jgi:hypothetical protein
MTDDPKTEARVIEQDIRQTQDQIGHTVERLEEQLQPKQLFRAITEGGEGEPELLRLTRENPIAAAMVAVGVIWLIAGTRKDDRRSAVQPAGSRLSSAPVPEGMLEDGPSEPFVARPATGEWRVVQRDEQPVATDPFVQERPL